MKLKHKYIVYTVRPVLSGQTRETVYLYASLRCILKAGTIFLKKTFQSLAELFPLIIVGISIYITCFYPR